MDILWYGLKVALVGMLVVFVGLIILIGCIKALKLVSGERQDPQLADVPSHEAPQVAAAPVAPVLAAPAAPRTYVPGPLLTRKDDALYAVLSAAIAATIEAEGGNPEGFAIQSVKTVSEPKPGPALTQKDDAFYAVITGAIAAVLEAEGVNPEGGFAIRSVKAL